MNILPLAIALLLTPNATGGASQVLPRTMNAEVVKCASADLPGYVTVLDGEIVRDYRGTGPDTAAAARVLPKADEVVSVDVRCLRVRSVERESGWALRSAVIIVTKSGARHLAHTQLAELVEEQRLHHASTGRFATSLAELKFTETRTSLGIEVKANNGGWSASVTFKDPAVACQVAVGSAAVGVPELRPGVPVCK